MPNIRLEHVAKLYKGNGRTMAAVLDVNLQIQQGEFIFFVGSRGAGKSTLLQLISGEIVPDRGAVFLDSIYLSNASWLQKLRLNSIIGKVQQESKLIRTETVLKNLTGTKKIDLLKHKLLDELPVQKALGLVGMSGCELRYPLEFSIPECRRIELAKAILHSPSILILDEITDRMDDDTLWDIMHLLRELNQRGTTILMATHASSFVNIMQKRVITLVDGKIVGDVPRGKFGILSADQRK
ncbi:MAG: ATP-binding cassette domain-containing protein [Lawsonibacter sp.]|nr:ATP-binding cassette domain-containing protein [Lawsonibacter sp.]